MRVLVTLTAYDPALPGTRTFYLTNGPLGFATTPSETPASQRFDPTLLQPLDIARRVQGIGGAARPALGELRVANADGAYDAWLGYAWDGRAVEVRVGPDAGAYPSDYPVRFTGTIDRVDVQRDAIVVRVRDPLAPLDRPLLTDRFAGDNVPPDGLEGLADLADRIKPRVYGRVKDIPLTLVNPQKLIYHVSDNECFAVNAVYDNGETLFESYRQIYVAVGAESPGFSGYRYSTDGVTWTERAHPFAVTSTNIVSVSYDRGVWLMGGDTGALARSLDALNWEEVDSGFDGFLSSVQGIAQANGIGIAVGRSQTGTSAMSRSVDRQQQTWLASQNQPFTTTTRAIVHNDSGEGLFVAVAGDKVARSVDGVVWEVVATFSGASLFSIGFGNGLYVAGGEVGGVPAIWTSPDSLTWTSRTVPASHTATRYTGVAYGAGLYCVVGQAVGACLIATSPDGITWTARTSAIAAQGNCILFAGSQFIVGTGAATGGIQTSPDGITWTAQTVTGLVSVNRLAYGDGAGPSGIPEEYTSLADLEDDALAPERGKAKPYRGATGTYVRLGFAPFGNVTADVTQGATAADRTPAALFEAVLTDAGYTSSDWVAGDFSALDTADNAECGVYVEDTETIAEVLDAIARTPGAWWGVDAAGDFRIQQLTAPSGSSTFTITEHDVVRLERVASSDPLLGLPSTSTTLRFAFGSTPLLDGTATAEDAAVLTTHLLAQRTEEETLYTDAADAQAEATRRQTLRGTMRSAFLATVPLQLADGTPSAFAAVDLGAVGTLDHPRFGLSGGVLVRVLGVQPDYANKLVTLTIWR